jgi:hypothetical protein
MRLKEGIIVIYASPMRLEQLIKVGTKFKRKGCNLESQERYILIQELFVIPYYF